MAVALGPYQLVRKLARGGMGQVYLAKDVAARRLVVVKRLAPELRTQRSFLEMFFAEAQRVQRLSHPRIVRLYEQGESGGDVYLALEYVAGADLRALTTRAAELQQPLTFPMICRIIADAAAGLDAAHHATGADGEPLSLVHRDVSPSNLLVGFDGATRITDFGIAKTEDSEKTETGVLKGKYPYLSPEQADFDPVDARSDVFSLGVVLWELLTRRRLFAGETDMQTLQLVRSCQVPSPSKLVPAVPSGLEKVAMRALAKEPRKRFPDAGAMAEALEELTRSEGLRVPRSELGTFVRALFPDRAALSYDAPGLDELAQGASLSDASDPSAPAPARTPSLPSPHPLPPRRRPHVRRDEESEGITAAVPSSRRPRKRKIDKRVAIGLALVAALTLGAIVGGRFGRADSESEFTAAGVTVVLDSEPPGAEVKVDRARLGRTPLEYALGSDAPPVRVEFSLEGYVPQEVEVSARSAPAVRIRLRRDSAPRDSERHDQ